jgi:hypothetical protein
VREHHEREKRTTIERENIVVEEREIERVVLK